MNHKETRMEKLAQITNDELEKFRSMLLHQLIAIDSYTFCHELRTIYQYYFEFCFQSKKNIILSCAFQISGSS